MKTLIVEDDFTSRILLQALLTPYGESHIAVNGCEAVQAFRSARERGAPYDLVCLDILMPVLDGQATLTEIRRIEEEAGIFSTDGAKIIMVTALDDIGSVIDAYWGLCDAYLVKPIDGAKLIELIHGFALVH